MSAETFSKTLTASSVHTPTALGNQKPKKGARTFLSVIGGTSNVMKRNLHAHDDKTAKTPFLYDVNALASLRPDQVPRFFGALTDADKLPDKTVKLEDLRAMQDRVDPAKVQAIADNGADGGKKPVVVMHNGAHYIADGHHRLAAAWLNGADTADVKFKDLTEVTSAVKALDAQFKVAKVDETAGLVFGWAIICKMDGQPYYDWNVDQHGVHKGQIVPEHVTEDCMLKSATTFALGDRPGNEQHDGPDVGTYPFLFPLTEEIAKAMGIQSSKFGLMCAYKPTKDVLEKFRNGTYTGFSIEGLKLPGGSVEHD